MTGEWKFRLLWPLRARARQRLAWRLWRSLKAEYARPLREQEIEVHKASRRAVLGRLDEEERAAGHGPW